MHRAFGACAALIAFATAIPAEAGEVAGRIDLAVDGVNFVDLGPTVVFLESTDGATPPAPVSRERAVVRQRNARFDPEFLVVTTGQEVEMPNDDTIFHNVFSFSKPNDFDIGVYPSGESRIVTLRYPGYVKLYCSIHESMSGAIVVTPTSWSAVATRDGSYVIPGVPAGSYRLTIWNEQLPTGTREIRVGTGSLRVDVTIGAQAPASGFAPR